jgi:hypothetical protein
LPQDQLKIATEWLAIPRDHMIGCEHDPLLIGDPGRTFREEQHAQLKYSEVRHHVN